MARLVPKVAGGSPAAVLDNIKAQEVRRQHKAKIVKRQRAELATARRDPSSHTDHKPGHLGEVNTDLIHADPSRFQYKLGAQHGSGSVGSLAGVQKYDKNLAGVVQVWKDPHDGKTYVVNGHNRLDLAKRLGAGKVAVNFLDAKGASDARTIGALTNIAEGRGTSVDAAKFFRETGHGADEIRAKGVPLKEKVATEGLALANLHDHAFNRVISGDLPAERAAIIGHGLDHTQQAAVLKKLDRMPKGKAPSNATLRETVEHARNAPKAVHKTHDLFGDSEEETSLALNRGEAAAHVRERLSREKKVFGVVSKSRNAADLERGGNKIDADTSGKISQEAAANLSIFDGLKHRSGPVADLLNEAATRTHKGEAKKKVHDDLYRRLPSAISSMLAGHPG